ncbi:MAG TPA: tubulin-like doman-containing protein [Actinomycetaceae bacterium]|nr:tubulin-like doman-containing protein [Actinomycetaceae bacterium]
MSLFPFLFIGVGGTGGKTVGMIHHYLSQAIKRAGLTEMPRGWQFLHIDVPANLDARSQSLVYDLPAQSYVPLTNTKSTYLGLDTTISHSLSSRGVERYLAWESWRPVPPELVSVQVSNGAGQFRTVGRVAAQAELKRISTAIAEAFQNLRHQDVQGQFDAFERASGNTPTQEFPSPQVLVFGSVAGGSGSGMLLDVCDVIRGTCDTSPGAVVFTPEVFRHGDGSYDAGVAPNTFVAMTELANAMWTTTSHHPTIGRDVLFQRTEVSRPDPASKGGPAAVYLVGRSGSGVTLDGPDEVYAVVARSFAGVATDPGLSNSLRAYGLANATARATGKPDLLGLSADGSRDLGNFGALGFGRVTLGREFFERYAAERLLRKSALRLLDHHLTRHFPGDGRTDDQVLAEAVEEAWPGFLAATGLGEAGDQNNDVKMALTPRPALAPALANIEADLATRAAGLTNDRNRIAVASLRAEASQLVNLHCAVEDGTLWTATHATLHNTVDGWADWVSNSLRETVVRSAAANGLPVTLQLLDRLSADLRQAASEVGGRELEARQTLMERRREALRTGRPGESRNVAIGDALIAEVGREVRQTLEAALDTWTLQVVAQVLDEARKNLVAPWRRAIKDADAILRREVRPENGVKPIDVWPGDIGVPSHLLPSRSEHTLDDVAQFPQTFLRVVGRSVGEQFEGETDDGLQNAVDDVVTQILAAYRLRLDDATRMRPASYPSTWVSGMGAGSQPPRRAEVKLAFRVADLEARVHSWLHDSTKEVGRFLEETLRHHLDDRSQGDSVLEVRHNRLVTQFTAALRVSRPLVQLDGNMVQAVHNYNVGNAPITLMVSDLDVPSHLTDLRGRLQDAAHLEYGPVARLSWASAPRSDAFVLSTFSTPYHMIEVASIMDPVSSQYGSLGHQVEFWRKRRARPLTEWTPLGPDAAQALITGWLVGRVLGRARFIADYPPVHEVYVDRPNDGGARWMRLRNEGIRPITDENQVGILLELVAVSFIDAYQQNSLQPLWPYQELIRLGSLVGHHAKPDPIKEWLADGTGVVDAASSFFPEPLDTSQDRLEALIARLQTILSGYDSMVAPDKLADVQASQLFLIPEVIGLVKESVFRIRESAVAARPRVHSMGH